MIQIHNPSRKIDAAFGTTTALASTRKVVVTDSVSDAGDLGALPSGEREPPVMMVCPASEFSSRAETGWHGICSLPAKPFMSPSASGTRDSFSPSAAPGGQLAGANVSVSAALAPADLRRDRYATTFLVTASRRIQSSSVQA